MLARELKEKLRGIDDDADVRVQLNAPNADGWPVQLGDDKIEVDDNGDFVLLASTVFHVSECETTDWQGILDGLDQCAMRLSSEAIMLIESLRDPGVDQVRDAIQDLESNRDWALPNTGWIPPALNLAIAALRKLKLELEKEDK